MSAQVKLDPQALAAIKEAIHESALLTAEAIKGEVISAQVMPFDNGILQNGGTYSRTTKEGKNVVGETVKGLDVEDVSTGDEIHILLTTDGPQARRLYFHPEYDFQKGNNMNAGGKWFESWLPGGAQENFAKAAFSSILADKLKNI